MTLFAQEILPLFETYRGDWLAEARRIAMDIGKDGQSVTIDDVRARFPPPSHLDPRVMGAVFDSSRWVKIGSRNSSRTACHQRPIGVFKRKRLA